MRVRICLALAAALAAAVGPAAGQTDEIQVYDGRLAERFGCAHAEIDCRARPEVVPFDRSEPVEPRMGTLIRTPSCRR